MSNFSIRPTTPEDAELTRQLMEQYWGGEPLLIRDKKFYPSQLNGLIAMRDEKPIAFLFYKIEGISCEIIVFEVLE